MKYVFGSLCYHLAVTVWTLCLGLVFLPAMLVAKKRMTHFIPRFWTGSLLFFARIFCGITHEVRGGGHIVRGPAIYAMKHQSAWETLALWHILPEPVFILKKELLTIPIFGQYLAASPIIAIDRKAGQKAIASMLEQARGHLAKGRQIVIFPEGTRIKPGETGKYRSGVAALYEAFPDVPLIPVALNSGLYWGRNSFVRKPGEIIIEFSSPVPAGLERGAFLETLKEIIETASKKLLAEAGKQAY